ncbi:hypothetical protein QLH51_08395 [Sphingomonas sp. 2R-10]|uniref:hypothetical protein n=1 Tax=Sphingomonas sp. 2R-10 TaxID=3045148 RepID=UPI0024B91142|nr:hypothetical protein [Sphingomonas sp. 2R-10]MDJ0276812.1 hypothetical protein [Sphingomonas sp. 2R-10]
MIAKFITAVAATTLVAAPVMAAPANPATKLSVVQPVRASASADKSNKLAGPGLIAAAIGAGIAAIGILAIVKSDESPDSN